jgi:predicted Rossmann-fold nucleotide-binding protein
MITNARQPGRPRSIGFSDWQTRKARGRYQNWVYRRREASIMIVAHLDTFVSTTATNRERLAQLRHVRTVNVMANQRLRPVIAVFGSTIQDTLQLAEGIGSQIAARDCILLTGGKGKSDERVSERAIDGAKRHPPAPWVGLERGPTPAPAKPDGSGIVLRPGYDHQRNYLEAHMCDVAIALSGKEGTPAEVGFCLALDRPVVLVGKTWRVDYGLSKLGNGAPLELFSKAVEAKGGDVLPGEPLYAAITAARDRLDKGLSRYRLFSDEEASSAEAIVDAALEILGGRPLPGCVPAVPGLESLKREYDDWIAGLP